MAASLSVNVDHIATLRQARRTAYPDPVEAARIAEDAGASGITVHLRVDRRHIQDSDVERLRETVRGKLNLEMSMAEEMLAVALRVRPDQVTLVPGAAGGGHDRRRARPSLATAGGWQRWPARLADAGIAVSLFVDPDPRQIEALARSRGRGSRASRSTPTPTPAPTIRRKRRASWARWRRRPQLGRAGGLHLYAGHGLTTGNVGPIAALPGMEELNIGHFLVSRAAIVGMDAAVREMLAAMRG